LVNISFDLFLDKNSTPEYTAFQPGSGDSGGRYSGWQVFGSV